MPSNHAHLQTRLQSQNTGTRLPRKTPLLNTLTTCDVKDRLDPFSAIIPAILRDGKNNANLRWHKTKNELVTTDSILEPNKSAVNWWQCGYAWRFASVNVPHLISVKSSDSVSGQSCRSRTCSSTRSPVPKKLDLKWSQLVVGNCKLSRPSIDRLVGIFPICWRMWSIAAWICLGPEFCPEAFHTWLVVLTILKNTRQWEGISHILSDNKTCSTPPTYIQQINDKLSDSALVPSKPALHERVFSRAHNLPQLHSQQFWFLWKLGPAERVPNASEWLLAGIEAT